jgi:hypothetical protein
MDEAEEVAATVRATWSIVLIRSASATPAKPSFR